MTDRRTPSLPERTDDVDTDAETPRCAECGSRLGTDEEHGETVCLECGLVVETDAIDRGPEWRSFSAQEHDQRSRVGAPLTDLLHDRGLSSTIDGRDTDANGSMLNARQRRRMQRLRTWDERYRTRTSKDRNLKHAFGEIKRMAVSLGLPETVHEEAGRIYRRALSDDLVRGRSIEAMATASLYAAARRASVPRSIDEVARVSRIETQAFTRAYRYIVRELDLRIEPADPQAYVGRFATNLDLSDETERRAHELLVAGKDVGLHSGRSPVGLAATAVYAATLVEGEKVTQSEVSDATDVSEGTIRNRYVELLDTAGFSDVH